MAMDLEKRLVEGYVIEKLKEIGWEYIEPDKLNRVSFDEPLLVEDLKRRILEINKDVELTQEDLKTVITKIQRVFTDQNGHKEILRFFKYGVPIKTEKERIVKDVQLFDYKNPDFNEFVFTNQLSFVGRDKIRLDLVLFVNGIPLVNIECKNPYADKASYEDAYRQIKRYERTAPELYKYIQIGIGFAEKVKYFPIVPWLDDVKQAIWRWEEFSEEDAIFVMLKPEVLIDILRNFLFMREEKGEMTKVIARYMQYRAGCKIYQRVIENLEGKTERNKGLIWHWQGSGKTLTMIFSAHKLYFELGKPTIFFIVDRRDLERQFKDELSFLDLNFTFEKVESIGALKDIIAHDNFRGKRGVFLTLIHKFNVEEEFLLEELAGKGEIQSRKDIVCFLDEVHRSQYGILATKMKEILKNAFFFGFTGTPISYKDRNTYKEFGYFSEGDKEMYLDKYFIDEAERDGFVVPLVYELRREEVRLKDMDLEWYLEKVDVEDISDELELEKIKGIARKRINEIKVFLEKKDNINLICEDLSRHFKENYDGKFKGLIVAGSRKACVIFKNMLDKYLPPEYSEVVITYNQNEKEEEIQEYRRKLINRFEINDTDEINKKIIESFQKNENPKLLIVTDMLITGFDEPKLAVLYLYKVLKNHRLLQTVARVNRPFTEKPFGLIMDYVGIFKYIKRAFSVYLDTDRKAIEQKIVSKEEIFNKFIQILDKLNEMFKDIVGNFEKEAFNKALKILKEEETGEKFRNLYKEMRRWFEFLRSDPRMISYLISYKWFSSLYEFYYKKLLKVDIDETKIEKYFRKTIELIHDLIEVKGIREVAKPSIIDLNYIKNLKNSDLTETEKTIGILTALKFICHSNPKNPVYKSIADKVRELVKKWQENEIDILALTGEVDDLVDYINEKEKEKKETGLNEKEFGIKLILENKIREEPLKIMEIAKEIYAQIKENLYPDWNKNPAILQDVSRKIREFLIDIKPKYKLSYDEFDNLHKEIFELIQNYDR